MAKTETQIAHEFNIKEFARIDDARQHPPEDIIQLTRHVYNVPPGNDLTQTCYPYPEAFDPEWLREQLKNSNHVWKVVVNTLNEEIVAGGTVLMDYRNSRAYVRGVMVHPQYQGFGLSGFLVDEYMKAIENNRGLIKVFWTENRTAHYKSQVISEHSGMRPVGLLPNKDVFLEKRESDFLYVLYGMNTFKTRRDAPKLIRDILPIYDEIGSSHHLDPVFKKRTRTITANGYNVKANIKDDKYHYIYCTYTAAKHMLKFEINPRTHVAEKMWYGPRKPDDNTPIDPVTLKTLLRFALQNQQYVLYYIECYVSAYRPEIQQVFIDLGFQPTGYIPAWDEVDGKREDRIVMAKVKDFPLLTDMNLTKKARRVAEAIYL